jgi:hypothetical protein
MLDGNETALEGELFGSFRLRTSASAGPRQEAPALRLGRQAAQSNPARLLESPASGLAFEWLCFPSAELELSVKLGMQRNLECEEKTRRNLTLSQVSHQLTDYLRRCLCLL